MKTLSQILLLLFSIYAENAVANEIHYPERAFKLNQSGYVRVVYDIDENGKVMDARIIESSPKFLFDDSVKEQLYKWKFDKGNPKKDVHLTVKFEK
ncbi:TonB family protein [Erwinia tracheiphila]|uniref:Protein TonB n=1 Tax=Erwinia tracheiphila TaxID=65700 RepID=A0A345CRH4_9GAMM|nr:TonB family protein [Erwinia tracheiphila]AXF76041.1 TonB family protein [Erwinia tracheiphila]UIA85297.1 TonB family protein [Erwinia tracheiphila]